MASDADRIIGIYQRHASEWDRDRGTRLQEKRWLDSFLSLLPKSPRVLDLGCGSGEPIARYLTDRGCRLTGVDSSPQLLEMCRNRFPNGTWIEGDMRTLDLEERFDGILAWDSFFHLTHDDQRRMFPRFNRLSLPRAALMFTSGPEHGEAMGSFHGDPLYHASLSPEEYRSLLATHGFRVVDFMAEDPDCGKHTVWLAERSGSAAE